MKKKKSLSLWKGFLFAFLWAMSLGMFAQNITVSGTVTDSQNEPVIGATILVKGTGSGTVTDIDGNYTISGVNQNATLEFSFMGMKSQEIKVGSQSVINVSLEDDTIGLDEVVAVGYGTQKKGNLTGSVSSVNTEKLNIAPIASTSNTLAGHLPGLTALQTTGLPGSDAAQINIRGFGNALVIVDGIEGDINNLDPSQIESISILKDGAASIYGARAGNGVILITSKRGVVQKPTITVNSSYTLQGVTKILHPASSGQTAEMEREQHIQSGKDEATAPWSQEAVDKFYAGNDPEYLNTDWYGHTFRDWAPQQNHNVALRGGTEKLKYYGYFGYLEQETMVKKNGGEFARYNFQSNVDADITDRVKMSVDFSVSFGKKNFPVRGLQNESAFWKDYYITKPWYPATLPDPDKVPWGGIDVGSVATVSNIDLMGYNRNESKNLRGIGTLTYDFKYLKGLQAKANINYTNVDVYGKRFNKPIDFWTYNPSTEVYTKSASFSQSRLTESTSRSNVLTQQYSLNYNNIFDDVHRVSGLFLYESINYESNNFNATRVDLLSTEIDQMFIGSTVGMGNDGSANEMGRKSVIGRINYSYKDRYLLETTLRADASAKFSSDERWGYFPSVSLGWIITEENFMQNVDFTDNLKLRLSYGESGNDAVGNFQYLSGYKTMGTILYDNEQLPGLYITGIANPFLTWENMTIYNIGLDYSFLNQNIYGTLDVFYRDRDGIPATRSGSLPSSFGSSLPPENINQLADRGFEYSVGSKGSIGKISYDISGNISWSRAKWKKFEEPEYEDPDQARINKKTGNWTDRIMGYVSDGLFTSQEEIDELDFFYETLGDNSTLKPGDVRYKDINSDGVLNWKDQKEIGSSGLPNWMYGVHSLFNYKNFSLTAFFQGAFGFTTNVNVGQWANTVKYDLRWTEEDNDRNALVPRLGGASTNGLNSDYRLKNVAYLRLKSASFGYDLSKEILDTIGLERVRFFVAGTNILTFSTLNKYRVDPEVQSGTESVYPQQRTISFGINASF